MQDYCPSFFQVLLFTALGWPFALAGLAYAEGQLDFIKNDKTGFYRIYAAAAILFWWVAILGLVVTLIGASLFWPFWRYFHRLGRSHVTNKPVAPKHQGSANV